MARHVEPVLLPSAMWYSGCCPLKVKGNMLPVRKLQSILAAASCRACELCASAQSPSLRRRPAEGPPHAQLCYYETLPLVRLLGHMPLLLNSLRALTGTYLDLYTMHLKQSTLSITPSRVQGSVLGLRFRR